MKLAVVAGEASGDLHASEVIRELKKLDPSLTLFGVGGDLLAREGMELVQHASEMGIVGLVDVVRHLPMLRRVFRELMDRIRREKPDIVFLIDYPGFNLRVAKQAKAMGLRVVYYISPQIWAWRQGRVRHIAKTVDKMIVVLPFEEEFYRNHGVPVKYVGHPLVEQLAGVRRAPRRVEDRQSCLSGQAGLPVLRIALLPGSRRKEVADLLPPMLDAVRILRKEREVDAYIIQAPTIDRDELEAIVRANGAGIPILPHDRGDGVAAADISLCASGTATLESAVLGTPVVVMYRLTRLTHWLGKRLVQIPYFSLVNIIAGKEVVPELIQRDVNGPRIAEEVRKMIAPGNYERLTAELARVRAALGEPGASSRAAAEIHEMVTR